MKMTYRKTNRKNPKKKSIVFIIVAVFILILINFSGVIFPQSIARGISLPFIKIKEIVSKPFNGSTSYFGSKRSLSEENEELRQKVSALEFKLLQERVRSKDDTEEFTESNNSPEGFQARVLVRPPFSPYDTFIIAIDNNEISEGNNVFVMGSFVGNVNSVHGDTATVKLRSSSGENTVVRIGDVDAEAVGKGGGRFTVTVPKDVDVEAGDIVTVPNLGAVVMGVITEIQASEAGSFNILHFSMPVSLSKISFVTITSN